MTLRAASTPFLFLGIFLAFLEGNSDAFEVRKIWDSAPHNAFTDLIRFEGRFYCTFREATKHVGGTNGKVRIISSENGEAWESAALIEEAGIDLRDPKLSIMPDGQLLMTCGGSDYRDGLQEWHTRVAYSTDGSTWTPPRRVRGIPSNNWFFRVTWHKGVGYVVPNISGADPQTGRARTSDQICRIYQTTDGTNYEPLGPPLDLPRSACEITLRFQSDDSMAMIVRLEEGRPRSGLLCYSKPPYKALESTRIAHGLGGPNMLELRDGIWLVGTREYESDRPPGNQGTATVLLAVDRKGNFDRLQEFPSGGDTSYPGMLLHDGKVWVSYYSSHEGRTSIYLATVPVSALLSKLPEGK